MRVVLKYDPGTLLYMELYWLAKNEKDTLTILSAVSYTHLDVYKRQMLYKL